MNLIKKIIFWSDNKTIKILQNEFKKNKIIITTTDTILGFLANLTKESFNNLNHIKEKRSNKPYLILIWPKSKIKNFIDEDFYKKNPKVLNFVKKVWPNPLTIIFKSKKNIEPFLTKNNKIALRCPKHEELQTLLKNFKGLFSTSANKTNNLAPKIVNELNPQIINKIDYIVIDKKSQLNIDTTIPLYKTLPSTIIDISNGKNIKIIRKGVYPIKDLEKIYGEKFIK